MTEIITKNFNINAIQREPLFKNKLLRNYLNFTINTSGEIDNVEILSLSHIIEVELLLTLNKIPKIIPGIKDGKSEC